MIVYDDFLPAQYRDELESVLMSCEFPWEYRYQAIPETLRPINKIDRPPYINPPQFQHVFLRPDQHTKEYDLVRPMLYFFSYRTGYKVRSVVAAVVNLLMPTATPGILYPHIDMDRKIDPSSDLRTLIYYVNDADGETTMYNERYTGKPIDELTIEQTLLPKKGRAAVFDSQQYHSGTQPTTNRRLLLSFVMEVGR